MAQQRDYRIDASTLQQAQQVGLASADWHACKIDRKTLKRLMKRENQAPLAHFGLWLLLLIISGSVAFLAWGTLWCIPAFTIYGMLYAASDHRAHELSHGTPFRTGWLNTALYHLTAFMTLHEANFWRWSHARHHTDTLILGSDREIAVPRPPNLAKMLLDLCYIASGWVELKRIFRHAAGHLTKEDMTFVPESERPKVIWTCRIYVTIILGTVGWCLAIGSILPALFIVLPRFYGGPLSQLFNLTQHTALAENVLDHRLNTRTVKMNPIFNFLYMNMNYHVEHHMFPMVPFYHLPRLHDHIKNQCPSPYPSLWAAYREIIPGVLRQRKDPGYFVERHLPEKAKDTPRYPNGSRSTATA
ncbi:fatty acid desaturase [Aidingimonas halophila]|uniref:Fatty acid desaturase n=1 Tax=Aidingimonas halophila TaxID=574349 RepID=A0A1H2ZCV5_9GAMM|nr:fatty acid desaturase [Aidingimonas halophila]GHC15777.1 fatty acid desaturase [Aidingimonas halophila]SDX15155.1 Fatty acid desaturase [Aidingimonas halophila]